MRTVFLLVLSNVFMTIAWYGHLKHNRDSPLWLVILISWGIAFFEYCLMVPANRYGYGRFNLPQLKVIQEVAAQIDQHGTIGRPSREELPATGAGTREQRL